MIYKTLGLFIESLGYAKDKVWKGYSNDVNVPSDDWVQITILSIQRQATPVSESTYDEPNDEIDTVISENSIISVQFDFIGDLAEQKGIEARIKLNSGTWLDSFYNNGILPLYAEDVENATYSDDKENYRKRFILRAEFNWNPKIELRDDYFNTITFEIKKLN